MTIVAVMRRTRGFTYVGLLIAIAIVALICTASLQAGTALQRHAAEEELLEIGAQIRAALTSYANATPAGQRRSPSSLDDLLLDPRYPSVRRHLRALRRDPITGSAQWLTIELGGGIVAVSSLADSPPLKVDGFDEPFGAFKGKTSYREWQFSAASNGLDLPASTAAPMP
jgi:type II secretory pathway pseudopilin PulG